MKAEWSIGSSFVAAFDGKRRFGKCSSSAPLCVAIAAPEVVRASEQMSFGVVGTAREISVSHVVGRLCENEESKVVRVVGVVGHAPLSDNPLSAVSSCRLPPPPRRRSHSGVRGM